MQEHRTSESARERFSLLILDAMYPGNKCSTSLLVWTHKEILQRLYAWHRNITKIEHRTYMSWQFTRLRWIVPIVVFWTTTTVMRFSIRILLRVKGVTMFTDILQKQDWKTVFVVEHLHKKVLFPF
jgi:hypothetical protein